MYNRAIEARITSVNAKLDRWFIRKMWDSDDDAKRVAQEFNGIDRALHICLVCFLSCAVASS